MAAQLAVAMTVVFVVPVALLVVAEPVLTTAALATLALTVHVTRHALAAVEPGVLKRLTVAVAARL